MGGRAPREVAGDSPPIDRGTKIAVLVVEDEPVIRSWIARVLERAGIDVVSAADGREALRLVAEGRVRPDVLLTDIEMPGMSGVELAARLCAIRPQLRVVMMTADPDRADAARAHPSIVGTVLVKPMDAADVVAAVRPDDATVPAS
jgi:CheY-like chemotaxis protein